MTSAAGADDFPKERLPEVALVGRSNVGKSSLLNALMRQSLARTSAAPGKTRLANFYRVKRGAASALFLVDLPGYGYARGGDASAREFNRLAEAYFSGIRDGGPGVGKKPIPAPRSPIPIGVLLLVDSRHPGLESDMDAWRWLQMQQWPHAVIGTKVDKLTRAERARHGREFTTLFDIPVPLISAHTGEGLDELWKMIASLPKATAA
ncbi:MAG TPA: GTPase [Vicinamibacterales bacterium]|nr:GTPase [Vicinamibacterales bacterium]